MKIVVDAMGGDFAPQNVIAGVVDAVKEYKTSFTLVGLKDRIEEELKKSNRKNNGGKRKMSKSSLGLKTHHYRTIITFD